MQSNNLEWHILEKKIREKVAEIIVNDDFASDDDFASIDDQTELFQSGILSSLSMIELLVMIEKETGSRIVNNETSISDFSTLQKILAIAKDTLK